MNAFAVKTVTNERLNKTNSWTPEFSKKREQNGINTLFNTLEEFNANIYHLYSNQDD